MISLLGALLLLLLASQLLGGLAQRLHQPRVIGEILGGMLFGPTVLGAVAPGATHALFTGPAGNEQALGFVYWLGLLLLMFCSGLEVQSVSNRSEARSALWLTATGTLIPLALGWALATHLDFSAFFGPKATPTSFGLILAMAIAVTSIPVISKILFDLGLMGTGFSRVVLTAAMIEDMALWVLLSITLGMAGAWHGTGWLLAQGIVVTIAYGAFCLIFGHRIYDRLLSARWNPFMTSAAAMPAVLVFLLVVLAGNLIGINPIFGALLAGLIVGRSERITHETKQQIVGFSFALFIPVYFASVGLKLDLTHGFSLAAFLAILVVGCAIKAGSAFVGAVVSGQGKRQSLHLAVAMNARGGPGIVLATVALEARLISTGFYAILILLSLVTSQLAGWWLQRVKRLSPEELDVGKGSHPLLGRFVPAPVAAVGGNGRAVGPPVTIPHSEGEKPAGSG